MAAHDDTYGYICKYSDGLSSISCYKLLNILVPKSMTSANYGVSSSDEIYLTSMERFSASFLSFHKLNMNSQVSVWNKIINVTPVSTDLIFFNRCKLSDDGSKLYTQVVYNIGALFMAFNSSNGSTIGTRYKALANSKQYSLINIINSKVYYFLVIGSTSLLVQFDMYLNLLNLYQTFNVEIKDWQSLLAVLSDTDFQLVDGTITFNQVLFSYVNTTQPSEIQISTSTSSTVSTDTIYVFSDITLSNVSPLTKYEVDVSLTCSVSGKSIISTTFSTDEGYEIPSWISLDDINGKLKVITPAIYQSSNYTFSLKTVTSEKPYSTYRKVYVQINCWISNCKYCEPNSSSKCSQCIDGYQVYSNLKLCYSSQVDETMNALSKLTISAISVCMGISLLISFISISSLTGVWTMINSYQVLMLLLLTGAFFPKLITDFMSGFNFAMFSFGFIPILKIPIMNNVNKWFDYDKNFIKYGCRRSCSKQVVKDYII